MAAPIGILQGLPDTGGAPFQSAERGAVETASLEQQNRRTGIAEQEAQQSKEKFALEKQFVPYRLKQAQQQVAEADRQFGESVKMATNRAEAVRRLQDLQTRLKGGEKITAEDMALEGANISGLVGDMVGMHHGISAFSEFAQNTEQGKAGADLWEKVQEDGLAGRIFTGQASVQDDLRTIGLALANPKAFNVMGKGLVTKAQENLGRVMPPAAVDAVKEFMGGVGGRTGADAATFWRETLAKHPDAVPYFIQNPKNVPPIVGQAEKVAEKVAEVKAEEEVKQPGRKEIVALHTAGAREVAGIGAASREKAAGIGAGARVEAAKIGAQSREAIAAGKGGAELKGIDPKRMADMRTDVQELLKNRNIPKTQQTLSRLINARLEERNISPQEAARIKDEFKSQFP